MKRNLMALSAHSDGAEVACGGIVLRHTTIGRSVGFVDLTRKPFTTTFRAGG